jgi:hypothetical protein
MAKGKFQLTEEQVEEQTTRMRSARMVRRGLAFWPSDCMAPTTRQRKARDRRVQPKQSDGLVMAVWAPKGQTLVVSEVDS